MKSITLNRYWFAVNDTGENKFNYVLHQLGLKDVDDINEVEVEVEGVDVTDAYCTKCGEPLCHGELKLASENGQYLCEGCF